MEIKKENQLDYSQSVENSGGFFILLTRIMSYLSLPFSLAIAIGLRLLTGSGMGNQPVHFLIGLLPEVMAAGLGMIVLFSSRGEQYRFRSGLISLLVVMFSTIFWILFVMG